MFEFLPFLGVLFSNLMSRRHPDGRFFLAAHQEVDIVDGVDLVDKSKEVVGKQLVRAEIGLFWGLHFFSFWCRGDTVQIQDP
jgi:hypothetical protein